MFEIAVQMSPYTWEIGKIARFAVSFVKAREDARDLGIALRRHDRHLRAEVLRIRAGRREITLRRRLRDLRRDVAARVFGQRDEVIGARARDRILEIDQADARGAAAL